MRHRQRVLAGAAIVEQLGNAEVQQLGDAGAGHQNVGRLQVAMHDEILMRVMHRGAHHLEQLQARGHLQMVGVAVDVDGDAVDVFHDDVGRAVGQRAAVQQVRDVRMIELRENLAFDLEAGLNATPQRAAMHHFDGHFLLEVGGRSLREVHVAHAADTQGVQNPVRSDAVSYHGREHAPRIGGIANHPGSCGGVALAW